MEILVLFLVKIFYRSEHSVHSQRLDYQVVSIQRFYSQLFPDRNLWTYLLVLLDYWDYVEMLILNQSLNNILWISFFLMLCLKIFFFWDLGVGFGLIFWFMAVFWSQTFFVDPFWRLMFIFRIFLCTFKIYIWIVQVNKLIDQQFQIIFFAVIELWSFTGFLFCVLQQTRGNI